jgi:hypothetical protein
LRKVEGDDVVANAVIGELQWSVYFGLWKHEGDGREAENWGGDRYAVLRGKDGKLTVLIATIWDSEYDAKLFSDAYCSTQRTRHPNASATLDGDTAQCADAWVQLDGQRVFIVDGGDEDMLDELVRGTVFN